MNPFLAGELQRCETCGQRWPRDAEHHLRAMRWLHEPALPARITASNIDGIIHVDHQGPDRFLAFELKPPRGDVHAGQMRLLQALAAVPVFTVVLLRGDARRVIAERVTPDGLTGKPIDTVPAEVRSAAVRFIEGDGFRPRPAVAPQLVRPAGPTCFTCGAAPIGTFGDGSPRFGCASRHMEAS